MVLPAGISGFLASAQDGIAKYLPDSSERGIFMLESSALLQVTSASLKNFSYVSINRGCGMSCVSGMLSARANFLESALLSLASLVYNTVMALLYTGLMAITFGLSETINYSCRRHWSHFGYSIGGVGISLAGIVAPVLGVYINGKLVMSCFYALRRDYRGDVKLYERNLIREVKMIFRRYETSIHEYVKTKVSYDRYRESFDPALRHIQSRISDMTNMEEFTTLIGDVWRKFPNMKEAPNDLTLVGVNPNNHPPSPGAERHYAHLELNL